MKTKTILLVDDDAVLLKSLKKVLERAQYTVVAAHDGAGAIALFKERDVDLIITDIRMPQMSGIEALRRIRALKKGKKNIPAIIITGYAGDEAAYSDEALGISDYIYKPFEIDELFDAIKKSIKFRRPYERASSRVSVHIPLRIIHKDDGKRTHAEDDGITLTVSTGGISFKSACVLREGAPIDICLEPSIIRQKILAKAKVIWSDVILDGKEYHYGVEFLNLEKAYIPLVNKIIARHKVLSEYFISLTEELRGYIVEVRAGCDQFEAQYPDPKKHGEYVTMHKEEVFTRLTKYFEDIWHIVKEFRGNQYLIYQDYFRDFLIELLGEPEVNKRIYTRPLGYPGDYITMNYIYEYAAHDALFGTTLFSKLINAYTVNIPIARSNIARKDFIKKRIAQAVSERPESKILSIAAGGAAEIIELLREETILADVYYTCLDFDKEALSYVRDQMRLIEHDKKRSFFIKYLNKDILSILRDKTLREEVKNQDLIYVPGVYNYLNDRMAKRLTEELFSLLNVKGELIICNVKDTPSTHRAYYEFLGGWNMIHRTKEDLMQWVSDLKDALFSVAEAKRVENYHCIIIKNGGRHP